MVFGETRVVHRFGEGGALRSSGLSTLPGPAAVMDRDQAQFELPVPFDSPSGRFTLELEVSGSPEAVVHVEAPGGGELAAGAITPGRPLSGEFTARGTSPIFGVRAPAGTRLVQAVISAPLPPGTRRGRDFQYGAGWSDPEPTHTWTTGQAGLNIPLEQGVRGLVLEVDLIPFSLPGAPPLSVSFVANGAPLGARRLERDGWFSWPVPPEVVARSGSLHLSFKTDASYVPADHGLGPDRRTLGVAFRRMRLRPDDSGSRGGPLP
jgi:hypothetical protein